MLSDDSVKNFQLTINQRKIVCTMLQYLWQNGWGCKKTAMNLRFVVPCIFNHSNKTTN